MLDKLIGLLAGYVICKLLSGGGDLLSSIFHISTKAGSPEATTPGPTFTSTAVSFDTTVPAGLPPWPSGWKPASPPTPAMVARAWALMPALKDGQVKYEMGDGEWLAYYKNKAGGKVNVTVFRQKQPTAAAPPVVSPVTPGNTVPVSNPAAASPAAVPAGPKPVLRRGMQGPAVASWQRAIGVSPADGKFGPGTESATKSWQSAHGLTPDGKVGPQTWGTVAAS